MKKINQKIPTTNSETPKSINCRGGRLCPPANKGITLVALVITIVILIILAGVTLNIVIDENGIINKSKKAVADYKNAQENEKQQISDAESYIDEWTSNIPSEFKKYILGVNGKGRDVFEIVKQIEQTTVVFLDEETTIPDASTSITGMLCEINVNLLEVYVWAKYEGVVYKITAGIYITDEGEQQVITKKVEEVYARQGNEGRTVGYDTNGNGTIEEDERWTVITDRDGIFEIVSNKAMGNLTLGCDDTTVTVTEDLDGDGTVGDNGDIGIASYNNAITTINNYCKTLVKTKEGEQIRSVGASSEVEGNYYSSTIFDTYYDGNADIKAGDMYYIQDFIKMKSLAILEFENDSYLFASRFVVSVEGIEQFGVRDFFKGGFVFNHILLLNGKLLNKYIFDSSVRPVVINPTEIQYID